VSWSWFGSGSDLSVAARYFLPRRLRLQRVQNCGRLRCSVSSKMALALCVLRKMGGLCSTFDSELERRTIVYVEGVAANNCPSDNTLLQFFLSAKVAH
jgi:hypothetical protein